MLNGCLRRPWINISRQWSHWNQFAGFKLGSGDSILFWTHEWIENQPLKDRFSKIYQISTNPSGSVVEFWDAQTLSWRISTRRALKDDEIEEFSVLLYLLHSHSPSNELDRRLWSLEPSGMFSVASISKLCSASSLPKALFKAIWKSKSPKKVLFLTHKSLYYGSMQSRHWCTKFGTKEILEPLKERSSPPRLVLTSLDLKLLNGAPYLLYLNLIPLV
ncbi:uncharacterized protein LOC111022333 [Momordica charantia]|uniref:Uncharacterized protein LOC111022333 n=1 Tax=Momordica charantia TaxID=3673 RepID=A0A6J1DLR8_MOMCH|nr:uncharacterized protein LOC111022333 [Momordica charantia]